MDYSEFSLNCDWAAQQLAELREDRLDAAQAAALRYHLDSCAQCSADATWDEHFAEMLRAANPVEPQSKALERVRRRLRRRIVWRSAMSVAAAALLAAGLLVWRTETQFARNNRLHPNSSTAVVAANDLPESPVLFAAPPVDSLDLLARQQAGVVAVIQELDQE